MLQHKFEREEEEEEEGEDDEEKGLYELLLHTCHSSASQAI